MDVKNLAMEFVIVVVAVVVAQLIVNKVPALGGL